MKSAIYLGQKTVEIKDVPTPAVGENDVLIQNICSSICGTDAAVYMHGADTGHKVTVGGEFGHETASRIAEVGKKVTAFQVGQRVYPCPLYAKDDPGRAGTLGGFSEYILIPNAMRPHALYLVDDAITNKERVL